MALGCGLDDGKLVPTCRRLARRFKEVWKNPDETNGFDFSQVSRHCRGDWVKRLNFYRYPGARAFCVHY